MASQMARLPENEFTRNTSDRIPVCIVIDHSGSMSRCLKETRKSKLELVKEALEENFINDFANDPKFRNRIELSIVVFEDRAKTILSFTPISNCVNNRSLDNILVSNRGSGDLAFGIESALNLLDKRIQQYDQNDINHDIPTIMICCDGAPSVDGNASRNYERLTRNVKKMLDLESKEELNIVPVYIELQEKTQDYKFMKKLTNVYEGPVVLNGKNANDFKQFFKIFRKSLSAASIAAKRTEMRVLTSRSAANSTATVKVENVSSNIQKPVEAPAPEPAKSGFFTFYCNGAKRLFPTLRIDENGNRVFVYSNFVEGTILTVKMDGVQLEFESSNCDDINSYIFDKVAKYTISFTKDFKVVVAVDQVSITKPNPEPVSTTVVETNVEPIENSEPSPNASTNEEPVSEEEIKVVPVSYQPSSEEEEVENKKDQDSKIALFDIPTDDIWGD